MKNQINQKDLDRSTKALVSMKAVKHKRPKDPTKKDLNRKFVMRVDEKGKPIIKEVS